MTNVEKQKLIDAISTKMRSISEECDENLQFEYDVLKLALAALTAPQPEPVCYRYDMPHDVDAVGYYLPEHITIAENSVRKYGGRLIPLYTTTPAPGVES